MKTLAIKENTYNNLIKLKEKTKAKNFDELINNLIEENKKLKKILLIKKLENLLDEKIEIDYKEFRKNFLKR